MKVRVVKTPMMAYGGPWSSPVFSTADLAVGGIGAYQVGSGILDTMRGFGAMAGLDTKLAKKYPKVFGSNFDFTKEDFGLDLGRKIKAKRTDRWNTWYDDATKEEWTSSTTSSTPAQGSTTIDKGTKTTTGGEAPLDTYFQTPVTGFAKGGMYSRPDGKIATNPILASAYDTVIDLLTKGHDSDIEDAFAREGGLTPQQARAIIQDIKSEIGMIKAQNGINLGQPQMQPSVTINKPIMKDGGHTFLTSQNAYTKKSVNYFGTSNAPARDSYTDNNEVTTSVKAVPREDATIEAEKGEYIYSGKGLYKIEGKKHYKGGTPLAAKGGEFIYSAHRDMSIDPKIQKEAGLKVGSSKALSDNTPAKILERNVDVKQYNRLKTIVDNPKSDETTKKTAAFMLEKMDIKLKVIGELQEAKKKGGAQIKDQYLEQGQIQNDVNEQKQYAHGGLTKYQDAGGVSPETIQDTESEQQYDPSQDFYRIIEFVHPTGEKERLDLTNRLHLDRYYSLYNRIASEGEDAGMEGNKPVTRIKLGNPRADLSEITIKAPNPEWTQWLIDNKGYLDELSPAELEMIKDKIINDKAKNLGQEISMHHLGKRGNFLDPRLGADVRRVLTFGVTDDVTAGEWFDAVLNFSGKELNNLLTDNYEPMGQTYRRLNVGQGKESNATTEFGLNLLDPLLIKSVVKGGLRLGVAARAAAKDEPIVAREVSRVLFENKDALTEGTKTVEGITQDLVAKYPKLAEKITKEVTRQVSPRVFNAGRKIGYHGAYALRQPLPWLKKAANVTYNVITNPEVGYALKPIVYPLARGFAKLPTNNYDDMMRTVGPAAAQNTPYLAPAPSLSDSVINQIDSTLNVDLNNVNENHVDNGTSTETTTNNTPAPAAKQKVQVSNSPVSVQNITPSGTHEEVITRGNKHYRVRVDNRTNRIIDTLETYAVGGNIPIYESGTPSAEPDLTKVLGDTYPDWVKGKLSAMGKEYNLGLPSVLTSGTQNQIQMRQKPNPTTGTYGTVDAGGIDEIRQRANKAGFKWFEEHPDWNAKDMSQNQQLMDAYNDWWKKTTGDPNAEYFKTGYKNLKETPGYYWRDEGKYGSYMNSMPFPYKKQEPVKETIPNQPTSSSTYNYTSSVTHVSGTTPMSSTTEYEFSDDYNLDRHLQRKAALDTGRFMAGIRQARMPAPMQLDQARTIFTPLSEQPTLDEAAKQRSEDRRLALRTGNRAAYQAADYKNQENVNNALAKINQYNAQGFDQQFNSDTLRNQGVVNTNRQLMSDYINKANLAQDKTDEYNIYNVQDYLGNLANNEQNAFAAKAALLAKYNENGMASTYTETRPDGTKVERMVYPTDLNFRPDPRWNGMNTRAGNSYNRERPSPEGFRKFQELAGPTATYKDYLVYLNYDKS